MHQSNSTITWIRTQLASNCHSTFTCRPLPVLASTDTKSCNHSCTATEDLAQCRAHHTGKPDQLTLVIATVSIYLQGCHRTSADLAPAVHTAHLFVYPTSSTVIHLHNHPSSHPDFIRTATCLWTRIIGSPSPRTPDHLLHNPTHLALDDHASYDDINHADHGQPH